MRLTLVFLALVSVHPMAQAKISGGSIGALNPRQKASADKALGGVAPERPPLDTAFVVCMQKYAHSHPQATPSQVQQAQRACHGETPGK